LNCDSSLEINQLIGNYLIKNENSETVLEWRNGPFLKAIDEGYCLVLDNFELTSDEIKGFIINQLLQKHCLFKSIKK
jgi:MoxR-like ATPase